MLGLFNLEVYSSIYNITKDNNKFKLYKFPDEKAGGISNEKVKDDTEKDLEISDITAVDLQVEIIAPNIFEEYREQVTKRMEDVGYLNTSAVYHSSISQDFAAYLRTEVDMLEDDIKLVLDEYSSNFITYELELGIYIFKDLSKSVFNFLQPEYPASSNVIVIELDDITMKTKLVVKDDIIANRIDE